MALHCLNDLWLVADKFTIALSKAMKNGHTKISNMSMLDLDTNKHIGDILA